MGAWEAEWEVWALGSRWVGLEGPGWLGAWAAGGAGCWLPPPRRAVGPVVPPLHFRAAGEGDGAASLSSLLPTTCLAAEAAVPSAELERRLSTYEDLLPGRNGGVGAPGISGEVDIASPEFWILG